MFCLLDNHLIISISVDYYNQFGEVRYLRHAIHRATYNISNIISTPKVIPRDSFIWHAELPTPSNTPCSTSPTTSQNNVNLTVTQLNPSMMLVLIDFLSQASFQIGTINSSFKLRSLKSPWKLSPEKCLFLSFFPPQGVCSK